MEAACQFHRLGARAIAYGISGRMPEPGALRAAVVQSES
jgi:hypothetical protein